MEELNDESLNTNIFLLESSDLLRNGCSCWPKYVEHALEFLEKQNTQSLVEDREIREPSMRNDENFAGDSLYLPENLSPSQRTGNENYQMLKQLYQECSFKLFYPSQHESSLGNGLED